MIPPEAVVSPSDTLPFEFREEVAFTEEVFPLAVPVDYAVLPPKLAIEVAVACEVFWSEVEKFGGFC